MTSQYEVCQMGEGCFAPVTSILSQTALGWVRIYKGICSAREREGVILASWSAKYDLHWTKKLSFFSNGPEGIVALARHVFPSLVGIFCLEW